MHQFTVWFHKQDPEPPKQDLTSRQAVHFLHRDPPPPGQYRDTVRSEEAECHLLLGSYSHLGVRGGVLHHQHGVTRAPSCLKLLDCRPWLPWSVNPHVFLAETDFIGFPSTRYKLAPISDMGWPWPCAAIFASHPLPRYTEEVPNSPFTLIELDPVNALLLGEVDRGVGGKAVISAGYSAKIRGSQPPELRYATSVDGLG